MKKSCPLIKVKEKLPSLRTLGIATERFPHYVNLKPQPHTVDVLLLSLIISGEASHWTEGRLYQERGPSLGVTSCGEPHTIVTTPAGIDIMNIYLNPEHPVLVSLPETLTKALLDLLPAQFGEASRLNRLLRLSFEKPEAALSHALGLHEELLEKRPGWEPAALDQFRLFLTECARSALRLGVRDGAQGTRSSCAAKMSELKSFIDANCARKLSLEKLAKRVGLNRNYLCRAFKRYSGKSIFEHATERRLQAATLALRSSEEKIAAVAFDCGFRDLSFFNKKFKEALGVSPSAYRKLFASKS